MLVLLGAKRTTKTLKKSGGAGCGNPKLSEVCLWGVGRVEENKELLNKSFSVREEAVIRWSGTAAKEPLLTFTSGQGQTGPPLPTTQQFNATLEEGGKKKRSSHKRILQSMHTQSHKYFPKRVEPYSSSNLNRYNSAIITSQWWNMQDDSKHILKTEKATENLRLVVDRVRLWFCVNSGWNAYDKNASLN